MRKSDNDSLLLYSDSPQHRRN